MSFPRLSLLLLPLVLGLPLLAGGCVAPIAVAAAGYGADGVSLMGTGKTTTDHLTSMVTKKDCAFWRVFRHGKVCRQRDDDHDPYNVNYDEPNRSPSEGGGVLYTPPLHSASDAPASSWDPAVYKASGKVEPKPEAQPAPAPAPVVAEAPPDPPPAAEPAPAKPKAKAKKTRPHKKVAKAVKKPPPDPAESSR